MLYHYSIFMSLKTITWTLLCNSSTFSSDLVSDVFICTCWHNRKIETRSLSHWWHRGQDLRSAVALCGCFRESITETYLHLINAALWDVSTFTFSHWRTHRAGWEVRMDGTDRRTALPTGFFSPIVSPCLLFQMGRIKGNHSKSQTGKYFLIFL